MYVQEADTMLDNAKEHNVAFLVVSLSLTHLGK